MNNIKKPSEAKEQATLMEWVRCQPKICKYIFAIPNGGFRFAKEAAIMKKMGVRRGVSDLFLAYPNGEHHGLWIEMKRNDKSAKLTVEQKEWIALMLEVGYLAKVAYGCDEAIEILTSYMS